MSILNASDTVCTSSCQFRGVTYVKEVAENMTNVALLPGGVYNFGSETTKSMYEITKDFLKYIGKNLRIEDNKSAHNLWMKCEKARKHGVVFSTVEKGLEKCADDYLTV